MHSNTLQGADYLAKELGYQVAVPDFFRGWSWDVDNIPPKEGRPFLNARIQERGSWDLVRPDLLEVIKYLQSDGKTSLGVSETRYGQ
jgi:dienelactone hydrolase